MSVFCDNMFRWCPVSLMHETLYCANVCVMRSPYPHVFLSKCKNVMKLIEAPAISQLRSLHRIIKIGTMILQCNRIAVARCLLPTQNKHRNFRHVSARISNWLRVIFDEVFFRSHNKYYCSFDCWLLLLFCGWPGIFRCFLLSLNLWWTDKC